MIDSIDIRSSEDTATLQKSAGKQICFKANDSNKLNRTTKYDTVAIASDDNGHTLRNLGMSTAIILGLAIVGDFIFAKGKHVKKLFKLSEEVVQKEVKSIDKIDVKFEKGKALTHDGKPFTGELTANFKDKNFTYEYKDGILQNIKTNSGNADKINPIVRNSKNIEVKFENGKALTANGKPFTGEVFLNYKDIEFIYEYKNGILQNIVLKK